MSEQERVKRIVYQNAIGIVLAEGRENYYVRFPTHCIFIPKRETKAAWSDEPERKPRKKKEPA
jgi:hypothetical protein